MKPPARMLSICCLTLLVPLSTNCAAEPPREPVRVTLGIEGEGLERIPVVGSLLQYLADCQKESCGEEEQVKLPPPPADKCLVQSATVRAVPIVSELPYVGQLFKEVVVGAVDEEFEVLVVKHPAPKTVRWVGPDGLERIGIDFDCEVTEACAQCQAKRCAVANATRASAVCQATAICAPAANFARPVAANAVPPVNCAPVTVCPPPGSNINLQACEVLPAPFAFVQQSDSAADRDQLIEALMEARIEAAVAHTTLKVREESDAKQHELLKELLSSQIENVKLTAKLALAQEKEKLMTEVHEAQLELAALKVKSIKETRVAQRRRPNNEAEANRPAAITESLR